MSNTQLNISMITKESLRILKNNLGLSAGINKEYSDQFAKSGAKIGSVINIRKPVRYTVRTGQALSLQDVTDQSVALELDTQAGVDFQFSSKELTLSIDEFSKRYIAPAIATIANKIDFDVAGLYSSVSSSVGTPGTVPNDLVEILAANRKMKELGTPVDDNLWHVINPEYEAAVVNGLSGKFHSADEIEKQYKKGLMGIAAGFKWKMDQNVKKHTVGALGGSPEVKTTVSANGATVIATEAWTASAASRLAVGDVFTVASVYAVNPQNRQSTGQLQDFVVTAAFSSDGSGEGDVSVSPAMYASGPYQNIDAFPVDGAALTVKGTAATTYPQNLAFHKDAFSLGCADLDLPGGVDMAARSTDSDSGLAIRIIRNYDINNDTFPCRLDILYGLKTVYPELACRVWG